jgi:anti-anti-sigma factor
MSTSLTLDTAQCNEGELALIAAGEIDMSNIEAFTQALATTVAARSGGTVTVDLSAVEYLDSGAINALVAHADHIKLVAHPLLMSALTVSGLNELVTIESAPPPAGR